MWQQVNLNPKWKSVGDCTVRAIAIATGSAWVETYLDLCLMGMLMADMPNATAWADTAVMDVVCVAVIAGTRAKRI